MYNYMIFMATHLWDVPAKILQYLSRNSSNNSKLCIKLIRRHLHFYLMVDYANNLLFILNNFTVNIRNERKIAENQGVY